MYLSLLQIKNFRCFDGNEHSITFKKGLNVLVGENDSGKSAIMDAIKLVLGTTDMNWYRVEQEDFYKEDATLEIKITCKFEELNEDERGAFLECLSYEDENKKIPCLYLHWTCRYLSSFNPPRPVVNVSTGIEGNGPSPSAEARELLRATYLRALRDAYSEMQAGRHSRLSLIMQHISVVDQGVDEYEEGIDIHNLSIAGIADLSNTLLAKHPALDSINEEMTTILQEKMLLKKDNIRTRLEVTGSNSNKIKKEMALLEKLDLAVDKDASDMCGRVGLGTSNIMSMACELLLHNEAIGDNKSCFLLVEEPESHIHAQRQLKLIQSLEEESEKGNRQTSEAYNCIKLYKDDIYEILFGNANYIDNLCKRSLVNICESEYVRDWTQRISYLFDTFDGIDPRNYNKEKVIKLVFTILAIDKADYLRNKQKYEQLKNKYRNPILHGGKSIFEIEPDINEIKKVDTYLRKTIMDYCLKIHSLSISTWEELDNAYRVQQNFLKL